MPETPSTPSTPSQPERTERPARPDRPARPTSQPRQQSRQTGDLSDVVENMHKVQAASDAGIPHSEVLAEAGVQPAPVEVTVVEDEEPKPVVMADTAPPPGLTERGWDPEVVSRHPQLLTETMAELLGEMGPADEDAVDPSDLAALQRAQAVLMSVETDLDNLRARAAAINAQRLGEAMDAARGAGAALRAAVDEAQAALQPQA